MAIEKPAGHGANEVIGESWPSESEDDALALADNLMIKAVNLLENANPALLDPKNTIAEKNQGKMAEAALTKMGVHINENDMDATAWANDSGWVTEYATAIATAKTAMAAAAESHESIHNMPTKQIPNMPAATQEAKDANLSAARHEVQTAKSTLDTVRQQMVAGLEARKVPPNGTPAIKPPSGSTSAGGQSIIAQNPGLPSDFPGGSGAGAAAKQLTTPGSTGAGSGSGGAAPAVTGPSSSPGADLGSSSGAGAGGGAASDIGAGQGMNGSPMGMGMPPGMPAGMPQGMPQGMPGGGAGGGQTPGNDVAKTIGDTVGKLADSQKGQPISKAALDDLYGRQNDGSEPPTNPDGGAKDNDGTNTSGKDDKKTGVKADGIHTTLQGPTANPYGAENTNPALNNPPAPHLNSPSPAAPSVTAAPPAAGAPITSLSADESGTTTPVSSHTQQHPLSDTNPFGGHGPGTPNSGPGSPSTQPPVLGPYAAGGAGLGPTPLPPQTSGALGGGGGGVTGLPASTAAATGAQIMGVTSVPTAVEKLTRAGTESSSKARHADRLAGLATEHLLAEMKLATIVDSFIQAGWAGTNLAIGVIMTEDTRGARLRYVLATADGLSVLPAGIRMPAGVELLGQQASLPFFWEQAGNRHAGQKLAAFAQQNPAAGQLVYLVSNDTRSSATLSGDLGVAESVQTDVERKRLADTGRILPAELTRSELLPPRIPTGQAAEFVDEFGMTWGLDRTVDAAQSAKIRLWAARWDRHRSADPKYPALLATYLYCEAREAISHGDTAEAAYSIDTALAIEPQRGAAAS